jgi:hypothetical protein
VEGHQTRIKRRHGLRMVSCTCGWSQEAVSNYGAWLAARRHLDTRARPVVREWSLLQAETGRGGDGPVSFDGGRSSAPQVARRDRSRRGGSTG